MGGNYNRTFTVLRERTANGRGKKERRPKWRKGQGKIQWRKVEMVYIYSGEMEGKMEERRVQCTWSFLLKLMLPVA